MTTTLRTHARVGTLSVLSATALAAALGVALPATAAGGAGHGSGAQPAAAAVGAPSTRVVTLVTGDRVVVRTDGRGHTTTSLAPHSPHAGRPIEHVTMAGHTWVVPRLAPSVRGRIDPSLFDVSALGARSGRVPLTVTFAKGSTARTLPGLDVRTGSAHRMAGGRTSVTASYDAHRPLPASLARSLAGVSRIAVADADAAPQPAADYQLRTLTINATDAKGDPLGYGDVFVMNLDDARLFAAMGTVIDGQWKVSVPEGHYVVVTTDYSREVFGTTTVAGDTTLSAALADATVKPRMSLPGYLTLSPGIDVIITDAADGANTGGGADFGLSGSWTRLNPLPATLAAGHVYTEVNNLWSKGPRSSSIEPLRGQDPSVDHIAAAKQLVNGIPKALSFSYHPGDFARVDIQHYATGPQEGALDGWVGWSPHDTGAWIDEFNTVRPGVVHALFLGSPRVKWASYTTVNRHWSEDTDLMSMATYRRGQHATVPFFRGPVTPIVDRGAPYGVTGPGCALCVSADGTLHGNMSMMTAAGTDQEGFDDHGRWQLYGGHSRLQSGRTIIRPQVKGIAPGTKLRLLVSTHAPDPKYRLSSRTVDFLTTTMPAKGPVPLLRAHYVPPTTMMSVAKHRQESFPISFDSLGPAHARVTRATVSWSTGNAWHRAALKRLSGTTFRASYLNPPATRGHAAVSLVIEARDSSGNQVGELVENAYLLPGGTATKPTSTHRQQRGFRPGTLCRTAGIEQYGCSVKLSRATRSAGRAAPDPAGWGAPALRDAYDLSGLTGDTTVAVIDPYDLPTAERDLNTYRKQFGLPACTSASGCFTKLNQDGAAGPLPHQDFGWGVEASLDLQMVSAACPTCHLVLVEAKRPTDPALAKAEAAAVAAGATVTTHSYGRLELTGTDHDEASYDHPGVTAVASTGDYGYGPATFPASSPAVVAVGGTTLARSTTDPRGWTQSAWKFGQSGCSAYFAKVPGQTDTACLGRTTSDVSAIAQGLAIYDTSLPAKYRGWLKVDGTSASSPFVAGIIGASGSGGVRPTDLYAEPGVFTDVVGGSNGFCHGSYLCTAVPGYDGPTGLGTPYGAIPVR